MIKSLIRLAVFPVMFLLMILEWCGSSIISFTGMLCRLIAGTIFVLTIIGFTTGLGSREYLIEILAVGFGFFLIPQIGGLVVNGIVLVRSVLRNLSK